MVGPSHGPPRLVGSRCTFDFIYLRELHSFPSRSLPAISGPASALHHQEIPPYGATMGSSPEYVLLGDIGATNARLALLSKGLLGPIEWFTVAEFARFADAVDAFLERHCRHVSVPEALLAVAGPVGADRCVLTNCPWTIDASELRAALGFAR